ncbi:MAG TPA: hypothetical protein VGL09_03100 [Methylomirabilota bacterium]|jgi:hypothetical protein
MKQAAWFRLVLVLVFVVSALPPLPARAAAGAVATAAATAYDFETGDLQGWQIVDGRWTIEEVAGAPSGRRALLQRETAKTYDVIVAPAGPYGDVDVTVRFKPISGREDASGGIVFRFAEGHYYLIRASSPARA